MRADAGPAPVRVDKWLWAARFFKTRALAQDAVENGRVLVQGERVKVARLLKGGELLRIRTGDVQREVVVMALSSVRGPAPVAQTLYQETPESVAAREAAAERRRFEREPAQGLHGRPVGLADDDQGATRRQQTGRARPAADRLLRRAQGGPRQRNPGVEQQHGCVAGLGDRLGPRCRHDQGSAARRSSEHRLAARGEHGCAGEAAAQLLARTALAGRRGAQSCVSALGAAPVRGRGAAPSAGRRAGRAGEGERPVAASAAGRCPASLTHEPGQIAT